MDMLGHTQPAAAMVEVNGDKVLVNGEHKAYVVHDEAVGIFYVGAALEDETAPYGFGDTLEAASQDWLAKTCA